MEDYAKIAQESFTHDLDVTHQNFRMSGQPIVAMPPIYGENKVEMYVKPKDTKQRFY